MENNIYIQDGKFMAVINDGVAKAGIFSEEAAECVSGIVGHVVEANVKAIEDALDEYTEEQEEKGEDVFFIYHEFTVVDD